MREKPAECDMFPSLMRPPCCPQLESNWVPLLSSDLRIISPALRTHCKHQCILPANGWVFFPLLFSPYTATSIHVSTGGSRTIPLDSESHTCSSGGFFSVCRDPGSFQPSASLEPFLTTQKFLALAYNPTQPSLFREWATNCCQKTNTERAGMPGGLNSITMPYFSDGP